MSQNDFVIANASGASVRTDMNSAFQALASLSSGATEPSTMYAYQLWADTTTSTLKRRNAANSGWLVVRTLSETTTISRSSNTILALSDIGKFFVITSGTFSQTLTAAATLGDGWYCDYYNYGSGAVTIDPDASETINGATTLVLAAGEGGRLFTNGTAFFMIKTSSSSTGSCVLLSTQTASASATLNFASVITSAYSHYRFVFEDLRPATDTVGFWMRTSTDNGSTYDSGVSDYEWAVNNTEEYAGTPSQNSTTAIDGASAYISLTPLETTDVGNAAAEGLSGELTIYNPTGTTRKKLIKWEVMYQDGGGDDRYASGRGARLATTDIDAVRFLFSSGNITSGKIYCYGYKNA